MAISTREWSAALVERVGDLQSALAFATRLPMPLTAPAPPLVRALRMLPLVGAIVGTLAAVVFVLATAIGLQPALAAVVTLAFQAWITGPCMRMVLPTLPMALAAAAAASASLRSCATAGSAHSAR